MAISTIWMRILEQGTGTKYEDGHLTEVRTMKIIVPIQTGFAATQDDSEAVTIGDMILHNGRYYSVVKYTPNWCKAVYEIELEEHKKLSIGVGKGGK